MTNKVKSHSRYFNRCMCSAIALTSVLATNPSFAQDTAGAVVDAMDEVVVTGSRIRRGNTNSPTPMVGLSGDELSNMGVTTAAEALNKLPQFGEFFGASTQDVNSLNQGFSGGSELVNLRNLGPQRTLVLVNGRRHVGGDPGTTAVDLNAIPSSMIERIEVISGAASSVYGADAVTGVVNIILKNNFEGLEVSARSGTTSKGDGEEYNISMLGGTSFSDDRGHALIGVEYTSRNGIEGIDRDFAQFDGSGFVQAENKGSTAIPGTRIFGSSGQFTFDENNNLIPYTGQRFQRVPLRPLLSPSDRILLNTAFDYDLYKGDKMSVNFFVEAGYGNTKASITTEPQLFLLNGRRFGGPSEAAFDGPKVPANNPFLMALAPTIGAINPAGVNVFTRLEELGRRTSKIDRDTFRIATGFKGDFLDDFSYEAYYQYGEVKVVQDDLNTVNKDRFFAGLDVDDNGTPGDFSDDVCADPFYQALGCTPVNIFGRNTITQEFIDYTVVDVISTARSTQEVISGFVTGDIADLPAGPLGIVFGAEYRKEFTSVRPDAALQDGSAATRQVAGVEGGYDVTEFFGEVNIPLLSNKEFFESLEVGGAIRQSDYSTVGNKTSWNLNMNWVVNSTIRFRGAYGTAQRAPNIEELFAPETSSTTSIQDPCDTVADNGDPIAVGGTIAANCSTALGGLAATFDQVQIERQTVRSLTSGNDQLDAEEAKTLTLGTVITPETSLGSTMISVDYISIKIDNVVTGLVLQDVVNKCYDREGLPALFCDSVIRDATTGQLLSVDNKVINAAKVKLEALDVQFNHRFTLGDIALDGEDTLDIGLSWSHLFKREFTPIVGEAIDDMTGQVGDFKDRYTVNARFTTGPAWISWQWRILGAALADTTIDPDVEGNSIGAKHYHDMQAGMSFGEEAQYRVTVGVKNLLDQDPPVITSPARTARSATGPTVPGIYDTTGRYFYVTASARF